VHCEPNHAFALSKGGTIYLIAFKNEQEALELASAVEHHITNVESWPEMKIHNGFFRLSGAPARDRNLQFLTVKKWAKREELLFFAAVSTLNLGVVSFSTREDDGYYMPFDVVPIRTTTSFYSRVFDNIYEE
jgi:hypothetical protein